MQKSRRPHNYLKLSPTIMAQDNPNVVFVFGDQWRAQAVGYHGNERVQTPTLDRLAANSITFNNAISTCPVCSPYRASLMTGQYPHKHGVFLNDVHLADDAVSLGKRFAAAGYDTGYIGKWHLDGRGRKACIPPESRQGFDFWKVLECTHDYNDSWYYDNDDTEPSTWDGYDAIAQTEEAKQFIERRADNDSPFLLCLSWGPPHTPYDTAPDEYKVLYDPADVSLRPNVPEALRGEARRSIAGYYAHCTALDDCVGELINALEAEGIHDNTIFIFTSDHGDMLYSHGREKKQQPYEESTHVPFLLHYPPLGEREIEFQIDPQDIMPTLLQLCDLPIPETVQGRDLSPLLRGEEVPHEDVVLLSCYVPFGQFTRDIGGREYRGVRTKRYTYVRSLDGPWLLYDNHEDPFQLNNLIGTSHGEAITEELDVLLDEQLEAVDDSFLHADEYLSRWGYLVDESRTTPTHDFADQVDTNRYRPVEYWQAHKDDK